MIVAGLRFDTSMTPGDGPGWSKTRRSTSGKLQGPPPEGPLSPSTAHDQGRDCEGRLIRAAFGVPGSAAAARGVRQTSDPRR